MHLYHGSNMVVDDIDLSKSRPNKDFGRGFYLSADIQQAWRMGEFKSITEGGEPVMNTFVFDERVLASGELEVKIFEGYTREWADFIFLNRNNKTDRPAHDYDIVYGPIANDRVGVHRLVLATPTTGCKLLGCFCHGLKPVVSNAAHLRRAFPTLKHCGGLLCD